MINKQQVSRGQEAKKKLLALGISDLITLECLDLLVSELEEYLIVSNRYSQLLLNHTQLRQLLPCLHDSHQSVCYLNKWVILAKDLLTFSDLSRHYTLNNYDIDFSLVAIQSEQQRLKPLSKKLCQFIDLDKLISSNELINIKRSLDRARWLNLFYFCNKKEKKYLFEVSLNKHLKLVNLRELLPAIIQYTQGLENLASIANGMPLLAGSNLTINTDISSFIALREWYKDVAFVESTGLGDMNTLLTTELADIKAVIKYYDSEISAILIDLDNKKIKLKLIYNNYVSLQKESADWKKIVTILKLYIEEQCNILMNENRACCLKDI